MLKRLLALAMTGALCICGLMGCASEPGAQGDAGATAGDKTDFSSVRIGTMPTEDMLPAWVAEKEGYFDECGVDAEIISFDSAQALSAAIAAGQIDMAMVDVPRAVKLAESGTSVVMEWVTLGTEADQGAFGVAAPVGAPYDTLEELADYAASGQMEGAGVGLAANTVPEYVFDKLCEQAGIDPASVPQEEVASLPERYSLMASGNLAAAALPGSMLELARATGLKVLADDTQGENISLSVMIATGDFAAEHADAVEEVAAAWDMAVAAINENPSVYAPLLAEKANLNETIAETYPISTYPSALSDGALAHPADGLVAPQIEWMTQRSYISSPIAYDVVTGEIVVE